MARKDEYKTKVEPYLNEIKTWVKQGKTQKQIMNNLSVKKSAWADYKKKYSELSELLTCTLIDKSEIELDWEIISKLYLVGSTDKEVSFFLGIGEEKLKANKEKFEEIKNKSEGQRKISLRRTLYKHSEKHPTIAVFLSKNELGMTEKQEIVKEEKPIDVKIEIVKNKED